MSNQTDVTGQVDNRTPGTTSINNANTTGRMQSPPRLGLDNQYNDPFRSAFSYYLNHSSARPHDYWNPVNQVERNEQNKPVTQTTDYTHLVRSLKQPTSAYEREKELNEARKRGSFRIPTPTGGYMDAYNPTLEIALRNKYANEDESYTRGVLDAYQQALTGRRDVTRTQLDRELEDQRTRSGLAQQALTSTGYARKSDLDYLTSLRNQNLEQQRIDREQQVSALSNASFVAELYRRYGPESVNHYLEMVGYIPQTGLEMPPAQTGLLSVTDAQNIIDARAQTINQARAAALDNTERYANIARQYGPGMTNAALQNFGNVPLAVAANQTQVSMAPNMGDLPQSDGALSRIDQAQAVALQRAAEQAQQEKEEQDLEQILNVAKGHSMLTEDQVQKVRSEEKYAALRDALTTMYNQVRATRPNGTISVEELQNIIRLATVTGGLPATDAFGNTIPLESIKGMWAHTRDTPRTWVEKTGGDIGNVLVRAANTLESLSGGHPKPPEMAPGSRTPITILGDDGIVRQAYINGSLLNDDQIYAALAPQGIYAHRDYGGDIRLRIPTGLSPDVSTKIIQLQAQMHQLMGQNRYKDAAEVAKLIQQVAGQSVGQ